MNHARKIAWSVPTVFSANELNFCVRKLRVSGWMAVVALETKTANTGMSRRGRMQKLVCARPARAIEQNCKPNTGMAGRGRMQRLARAIEQDCKPNTGRATVVALETAIAAC